MKSETSLPYYGKPARIVWDPDGAFRNKELTDWLGAMNISVQPIAGETHWQAGLIESNIRVVKRTVRRLIEDHPEASPHELFEKACCAHNEFEQIRGFSPFQWALGKSPHHMEEFSLPVASSLKDSRSDFAKVQRVREQTKRVSGRTVL